MTTEDLRQLEKSVCLTKTLNKIIDFFSLLISKHFPTFIGVCVHGKECSIYQQIAVVAKCIVLFCFVYKIGSMCRQSFGFSPESVDTG